FGIPYYSVTNYTTLIETAEKTDLIDRNQMKDLHEWRKDPAAWSARRKCGLSSEKTTLNPGPCCLN
nr:hypothetical protein [Bifidobacterium bifidum]